MFLPEHKEAYLEHRRHQFIQDRPKHDEQAWEELLRLLQESKEHGRLITIIKYGQHNHMTVTGIVERLEQARGIRIANEWIHWHNVVGID